MKNIEKEIEKKARELNKYRRKLIILDYISKSSKSINRECEEFGISKTTYFNWKRKFDREGPEGLKRKKPIAYDHPNKISQEVVAKILELRKAYQLGSIRITWYLERYHGINISESSVYRTLARNGMNRLPKTAFRRTVHTKRYSKKVPGHHVQVDVKFVTLTGQNNRTIRRYQYTAIDDSTRIRALKIYSRHNQANAIDFIKYVIDNFPFRIHTIRTDRGHDFQARFHWFVEDLGVSRQHKAN